VVLYYICIPCKIVLTVSPTIVKEIYLGKEAHFDPGMTSWLSVTGHADKLHKQLKWKAWHQKREKKWG